MLLLLFARHEAWVYAAPHNTFMPSLAKEVSERVTASELGVGDRIFGQIPFDGGSKIATRHGRRWHYRRRRGAEAGQA